MPNILICDDEKDIVNALKIYLSDPQYTFFEAFNGLQALEILQKYEIHLVLLDIMMPEMDGITALSKIREISNVPVIMLSAKGEDTDKIMGLSVGADDYVTKPFSPMEVAARVKSQLRRYMQLGGDAGRARGSLVIGGLELDDQSKQVTVDGDPVALTPKEYDILKFFMENPGTVYTPAEIYRQVWKESPYGSDSNTVAVHIRHLREKIETVPADPRYIRVIFGQGYKMERGRKE